MVLLYRQPIEQNGRRTQTAPHEDIRQHVGII